MTPAEKVVVTGATGVVGGALLRHLRSEGIPVRALVRTSRQMSPGIEVMSGDVLDPDSLTRAFSGAAVVYHVAGINQMCPADPAALYRVNVDGTRNVLKAARSAKVERIVYTSSAATIGEAEGEIGNEDTLHRGNFYSHYERSKFEAEEVVRTEGSDLDVVIVNPSSVQGPGRATGTGKLLLDLIAGRISTLLDTRLSVVDIDDCARGHVLAAARGNRGHRYILNSFSMTTQEAVALIERVTGRHLKVRYAPSWLASVAGFVVGASFRAVRRNAPLCAEVVRTLIHGHIYDGTRATRELGLNYTPAHETLGRLIDWARAEGFLREHRQ